MIFKDSFKQYRLLNPCIWLVALLFCLPAQAENSAESQGSIGYSATNYFYYPTPTRQPLFQSFDFDGSTSASNSVLEGRTSGKLVLLAKPKVIPNIEVPELYVGTTRQLGSAQIHLGRKIENWSALDDQWRLGLWQPRFRWDYFHPETVGLTGIFSSYDSSNFWIKAFASPLFIPERGIPISVQNGEFESPTAWFNAPTANVSVMNEATRVRYSLEVPSLREIVLHPGGAIQGQLGKKEGFWISGAYAYKPVNQLLLANNGYLALSQNVEIPATIRPRVIYHHLSEIETGYRGRPVAFFLSAISEVPVLQPAPSNWTIQNAKATQLFGTSISVTLGPDAHATWFDLGFLKRFGGNAPDSGINSTGDSSVFEPRYQFSTALRAGASTPLSTLIGKAGINMNLASKIIYDTAEDGALWLSEFRYAPLTAWHFKFGADLLATEVFTEKKPGPGSFITRYKANNRIYGGVSYVF